jgi:hypothetical protein
MRKTFLLLAIFAAAAFSFAPQTLGATRTSRVTFREPNVSNPQAADTISALCKKVKLSYDPQYREYSEEQLSAEPNDELEQAEREYFQMNCDQVAASFAQYKSTGSYESFNELVRSMGELRHYQSKSPALAELSDALCQQFSLPNLYIEASERFLSAMARREITENFNVQEYIRGTLARGTGVAQGYTAVDLRQNAERAEVAVIFQADVNTKTVGTNRGVDVYSNNYGKVTATKTIFVNPNGAFTTTPSTATGRLKTNVNSFDANRPTPLGGRIIQNKINQELPFTEHESSLRVNQRVAEGLEKEANSKLYALNQRIERMKESGDDPMIRKTSTSSSDSRFFFSCVLGRCWQLAAPVDCQQQVAAFLLRSNKSLFKTARTSGVYASEYDAQRPAPAPSNIASSSCAPANCAPANCVPTNCAPANCVPANCPPVPYRTGPVGTLLAAPFELVSGIAGTIAQGAAPVRSPVYPNCGQVVCCPNPAATQSACATPTPTSAAVEPPANADCGYDIAVKLHQSGPNNAVTVALAGAKFGPGADTIDAVIARFPAVNPDDVKKFLTPYEPKEERALDPEDNYKEVSIEFDDVRPFMTQFEDGKIMTVLRIASCVSDGKVWPPVEVRLVYNVEKRSNSYAFVREMVDVLPQDIQEGETVSARFHTFRRIFMKRMERTIQDEYVVVPIPLEDPSTGEKRGALIPSLIDVDAGWISLGFNYDPNYQTNEAAK